jgi:hypothetical protein
LAEFARLIGSFFRAGYIVVLDEFQYLNRAHLLPFCSSLRAEVDTLSAQLREHADTSPERPLFLWTLFEVVPKPYRDCHEQRQGCEPK